jgi:hypothetical protein
MTDIPEAGQITANLDEEIEQVHGCCAIPILDPRKTRMQQWDMVKNNNTKKQELPTDMFTFSRWC